MTPEDFDAFYAASRPRLVGQLVALTADPQEAQDVVQEAFLRAWDRRAHVATLSDPEQWVRTVAWRLAISRWRKARTALTTWRRHGAPRSAPDLSPDHVALVDALRTLTEEQRRAVVLHHLVDRSVAQVAAETGVAEGTVKARLSRGRQALAAALADPGQSAPTPDTDSTVEPRRA